MYPIWTVRGDVRLTLIRMVARTVALARRNGGVRRARISTAVALAAGLLATVGIGAGLLVGDWDSARSRQAMGYLCRSSGLVLLVLFTATVVCGLLVAGRAGSARWPRFVVQSVHRNLTVVSLLLLSVHIVAPAVGGYLGIKLIYAVVPFAAGPVRVWTRVAATATDMTLLIAVTSAARVAAGYRFWRTVHATAYLAWALAMVHALGIGSDRTATVGCAAACALVVVAVTWYRLVARRRYS
jgi:hypothetical protein